MEKPAVTNAPLEETIKARWSPRAFEPTAVTEDQMNTILEAARWAPSSSNVQNWKFIYAYHENQEAFLKLRNLLQGGNNAWAPNAGVLLLAVVENAKDEHGAWKPLSFFNVGLAVENIMLQTSALGLYAHAMAGYDAKAAIEVLELNEQQQPICLIAIGHFGKVEDLTEPFLSRETAPRERKSLAEISVRL